MMKTNLMAALGYSVLLTFAFAVQADQATLGKPAPDFTLTGADGQPHHLSDFKGKFVVLEWTSPGCPFVAKYYESGTMQTLQKEETAKGVAWLRINSSGKGLEGYQTEAEAVAYDKSHNVASTATLLDPDGKVGHLYGAKATPQVFVINPQGVLIYAGGIDDSGSADKEDLASAKNYVRQALDEALAGKPVSVASSRPFGCAVKYAN